MNRDDGVAMAGEGDRVAGVSVLLPDLIQRRWTKGSRVLDLPDRSAGSEGPGGRGLDRRMATVALGMNERVRERGTSKGEEADLGLARVWQGRGGLIRRGRRWEARDGRHVAIAATGGWPLSTSPL